MEFAVIFYQVFRKKLFFTEFFLGTKYVCV